MWVWCQHSNETTVAVSRLAVLVLQFLKLWAITAIMLVSMRELFQLSVGHAALREQHALLTKLLEQLAGTGNGLIETNIIAVIVYSAWGIGEQASQSTSTAEECWRTVVSFECWGVLWSVSHQINHSHLLQHKASPGKPHHQQHSKSPKQQQKPSPPKVCNTSNFFILSSYCCSSLTRLDHQEKYNWWQLEQRRHSLMIC